jgi:hypothetical protein
LSIRPLSKKTHRNQACHCDREHSVAGDGRQAAIHTTPQNAHRHTGESRYPTQRLIAQRFLIVVANGREAIHNHLPKQGNVISTVMPAYIALL